jgi:hypothetical protein
MVLSSGRSRSHCPNSSGIAGAVSFMDMTLNKNHNNLNRWGNGSEATSSRQQQQQQQQRRLLLVPIGTEDMDGRTRSPPKQPYRTHSPSFAHRKGIKKSLPQVPLLEHQLVHDDEDSVFDLALPRMMVSSSRSSASTHDAGVVAASGTTTLTTAFNVPHNHPPYTLQLSKHATVIRKDNASFHSILTALEYMASGGTTTFSSGVCEVDPHEQERCSQAIKANN